MKRWPDPFAAEWSREDLQSVTRTILKRYNVGIHSQSTIDALLEHRAALLGGPITGASR